MDSKFTKDPAAIHRIPLELWAAIMAYAYSPEHDSPTQFGERLLPTDWYITRLRRQAVYHTGLFATSACVSRAHPAERALTRQAQFCSLSCGQALDSPERYIPSILNLAQVDKRLQCMAFGLPDAWARNALSIPARLSDALRLSGDQRPLHLATPIGICEHILLLLGPHLHRAITFKTALPSHCRADPSNSAALYLADCLAEADGLTHLELYFDAALPAGHVYPRVLSLHSLQSVRLQNSPVLFWSAGLTELDLATEVPEWTWRPSELLAVLDKCPRLQFLTLQLVLLQDDEYIWMTEAAKPCNGVILSDLRLLSCDCRDYELVTLLYALRVPATVNLHYSHYGVVGPDATEAGLESTTQMGVTLSLYARPHHGIDVMQDLLSETDDPDHGDAHNIVVAANVEKDRSETNNPLPSQTAVDIGHYDAHIQAMSKDHSCELFWSSAVIAGLDIHIPGEQRLQLTRRPHSVTLVQGSHADEVRALLDRKTHPSKIRNGHPLRSVTLHDIALLVGDTQCRDCLPGEAPFDNACEMLWQYGKYVGTDPVTTVIIGKNSCLPDTPQGWYQVLHEFPNAERIDLDGRIHSSQTLSSLSRFLADADELPRLVLIVVHDCRGRQATRGPLNISGNVARRPVPVVWQFVTQNTHSYPE